MHTSSGLSEKCKGATSCIASPSTYEWVVAAAGSVGGEFLYPFSWAMERGKNI